MNERQRSIGRRPAGKSQDPTSARDGVLTARTREALDDVAARAVEHEQARRLPRETFELIRELGFFRALVPARYGGDEADVQDVLRATRLLSSADASTGWVAGLLAVHQHGVAYFDQRAQDEVWATGPDTIVVTSGEPVGRTELVDGGIRLSGRWRFSSGSDYASWIMVGYDLQESASDEPARYWALLPDGDFRVEDTWYTYGLCGSGSKDVVVDGAFVPEHRWLRFSGLSRCPGLHANGLYRLPQASVFDAGFAAVALGTAEGAFAEHTKVLKTRTRPYTGQRARQAAGSQLRLGESSLELRVAAAVAERHWASLSWYAREDVPVGEDAALAWREEDCYVAELGTRAVERILKGSGGSAVYSSGALQRFWRDVHAIRGHVYFDFDSVMLQHAQRLLGMEADASLDPIGGRALSRAVT